ncbi:hypothetical protein DPSP01_000719 [Paraphaeosphaeria sporulosa]|uniref:F-box domain-containing protein n=1 Tax=Paraphaeosphaeria sporulosa TaxID=1460663 RepID=A0A177CPW9_9PLEO|nr:uncharacterized protein CC84DRAFT_1111059 [Paraphaeosphaeria sporulosa]OAG09563.1 hypothetical protein CC84DRAFT_1111059 [Paraphaeosphaeria sporulosa]
MAPELRRSKRNQPSSTPVEKATSATPDSTNNDAPTPRKRARKAVTIKVESNEGQPSISKSKGTASPIPSATEPSLTRPSPQNHPLPPFLALPRELRDEVYKHILSADSSTTLKSGSSNLATRCGLVGVNAQLCEEFLDAVLFHAPVITTTVRNHNFAHVVTFLNRLSSAQLARLSTRPGWGEKEDYSAKPKRQIRIILSYTAGARDTRAHLNRWLDRFDDPDKRGKEIEFEYAGDGSYRNGGYKQRPRTRAMASERWNSEAAKIGKAAAVSGRAYGGWGWHAYS